MACGPKPKPCFRYQGRLGGRASANGYETEGLSDRIISMDAHSDQIKNPMNPMKVRIAKKLSSSPVNGHNVPTAKRRKTVEPSSAPFARLL